jgi:hypothetical protein
MGAVVTAVAVQMRKPGTARNVGKLCFLMGPSAQDACKIDKKNYVTIRMRL